MADMIYVYHKDCGGKVEYQHMRCGKCQTTVPYADVTQDKTEANKYTVDRTPKGRKANFHTFKTNTKEII